MLYLSPPTPHGVTGKPTSIRAYERNSDRQRAIAALRKRGHNYFVRYADTRGTFALYVSWAEWASPGYHVG